MNRQKTRSELNLGRVAAGLLAALAVVLLPASSALALDVCGCAGSPASLGDWDSTTDPATWPFITRSEYDADGNILVVSEQISVSRKLKQKRW